jgi:hypothetical protein
MARKKIGKRREPTLLSVYDGQILLGTIEQTAGAACIARAVDDSEIGRFASQREAMAALGQSPRAP